MVFYDLIHGYQPFEPKINTPKWVRKNLKEVFLPTSLAMKKGLILRGVQLQGWTIESWLNSSPEIRSLAKKTLYNLKKAGQKRHIEIGTSAYSHPILPMLSNDLIKIQLILDKEIIEKYLGQPTWFWSPEGAVDQRVLKIIHQIFPSLILLIPDKAIGKANFSGPIKIKFKNSFQKAIVFNTLFKDLFMNAEDYCKRPKYVRRPKHLSNKLVWSRIRRIAHSSQSFLQVLKFLKTDCFILMRDWENAGSRKGLRKSSDGKEIGNFLKFRNQIEFRLPSQFNWPEAETFQITSIRSATWDMDSVPQDPFPWWQPNRHAWVWQHRTELKRKKVNEWQAVIKEFDQIFQQKIKEQGGLKKSLQNKRFKNLLKQSLPIVHSCVGWHYLAKKSWSNYRYAQQMFKQVVLPCLEKLKNI